MDVCFHWQVPWSSFPPLILFRFFASHTFPLPYCPPLLFLFFMLRQTGSVRSGQVISGLIGRWMFLQKPGTLTCLSSSLIHFLPNGKSQTCWRLAETQTTVLFEDFSQPVKEMNDTRVTPTIIRRKPQLHSSSFNHYWGYRNTEWKRVSVNGLEE